MNNFLKETKISDLANQRALKNYSLVWYYKPITLVIINWLLVSKVLHLIFLHYIFIRFFFFCRAYGAFSAIDEIRVISVDHASCLLDVIPVCIYYDIALRI